MKFMKSSGHELTIVRAKISAHVKSVIILWYTLGSSHNPSKETSLTQYL